MKKNKSGLFYSKREEYINSISHVCGAVIGFGISVYFLIWSCRAGDMWAVAGVLLYMLGMCGSYIVSSVYHSLKHHNPLKKRFRQLDHAAIYWHIAGSYSPITLTVLREQGAWGWTLFSFVWLCAIIGTFASFREMENHSHIETLCYVVMGLSVLVAFKPLFELARVPMYWILGEGAAYITGAVLYSFKRIRYAHSVFHFFVIAGSACHIVAIWLLFNDWLGVS